MTDKNKTTEEKILDAAKAVFVRKGFAGTSMQDISDEAEINKALLHYYFRSKEKLFRAAFFDIFQKFIPQAAGIFMSDQPFVKKIELFIHHYIDVLNNNPLIPLFILQEINRDPESLFEVMKKSGMNPSMFIKLIALETKEGEINIENPKHFIINLLGLCIFPFAARPLLQRVFFDNEQDEYNAFLQERKKAVTQIIINSIKKK